MSSEVTASVASGPESVYDLYTDGELQEFAGLLEHPKATQARLEASGVWDREARGFYADELARNRKNPELRKRAKYEAWRAVQDVWKPPAGSIPIPTLTEQNAAARERAKIGEVRRAAKKEARGCRPPKLRPEESRRFREIDEEVASGRRRRDPLDDIEWVYHHIDDDSVTAMDAPSRGAWSSLFFARGNRIEFFKSTWPAARKELARRSKSSRSRSISEPEQERRDEIREMIKAAVKHSEEIAVGEFAG